MTQHRGNHPRDPRDAFQDDESVCAAAVCRVVFVEPCDKIESPVAQRFHQVVHKLVGQRLRRVQRLGLVQPVRNLVFGPDVVHHGRHVRLLVVRLRRNLLREVLHAEKPPLAAVEGSGLTRQGTQVETRAVQFRANGLSQESWRLGAEGPSGCFTCQSRRLRDETDDAPHAAVAPRKHAAGRTGERRETLKQGGSVFAIPRLEV
mmetsp:Transcript_22545/g.57019  ORF Transcript_22545/g.57019 Transcript_22545/m.57019 type:complete len:204 (-) Transcript_22545:1557-2168(-)